MRQVLALHCMLAAGAAWRGVQAALPEARLICPDLPGHGRAPTWDDGRAYMDQAADLAMEVAPDGDFDVVGHSYGGCVALRILADLPERVRTLTVVEPVMFAAAKPDLRAAHGAGMEGFRAAMDAGDLDAAARAFTSQWGDGSGWDAMPERQRAYIRDRIHLVSASGSGISDDAHDILERLPDGKSRVSIVVQNDPPAIVAGIAQGLSARMPQARVTRIGAGHMIPLADGEELAAHLGNVWNEVDPAR